MANETMRIFFPLKIVTYPQFSIDINRRQWRMRMAFSLQSPKRTATLKMTEGLLSTSTMKLSVKRCIAYIRQWKSLTDSCGES